MYMFAIILILWAFFGIKMVLDCKENKKINWAGIIFMGFVPFLPIIAHSFHVL